MFPMQIVFWLHSHGSYKDKKANLLLWTLVEVNCCSVLLTDLKGIHREADWRGGEQLEGAVEPRSRSCSSDNVHDCNVNI